MRDRRKAVKKRKSQEKDGLVERFLDNVAEQISCKQAVPDVIWELDGHLEDRIEELQAQGRRREDAERIAVQGMGDPAAIGVMMNEAHQTRTPWRLLLGISAVMILGLALSNLWYPFSGFYFFWGAAVLAVTIWKGYPWLIRYGKEVAFLFLAGTVMECFVVKFYYPLLYKGLDLFRFPFSNAVYMLDMPVIVLFVPIFTAAAYRLRAKGTKGILIISAFFAAELFGVALTTQRYLNFNYKLLSLIICFAVVVLLTRKGYGGRPDVKYAAALPAVCAVIAGVWMGCHVKQLTEYASQCFAPHSVVSESKDRWKDAYNSLLVKELYGQAKILGPVPFTQEELRNYRTAVWLFDDVEEKELSYWMQGKNELTVEDVLPQHWSNNNLITYVILRFGFAAGALFVVGLFLFYWEFWRISLRIRNRLGRLVSFSCAAMLTGQALLYIAGNFGYQFGWFPVLPLLSEGTATITANAVLAGVIISAWRYDRVIDESRFAERRRKKTVSA